jgi:hypothetical protein
VDTTANVTLGIGTLDAAGMAMLTTSALALGTHAIGASYAGDANFAGSTAGLDQVVNLPPPAVITVTESIHVSDDVGLLPSAMFTVTENITVHDAPALLPSAMFTVVENVVVHDTPTPLPSAMLTVTEAVSVHDSLAVANTGAGANVIVRPTDPATGGTPVTVTFSAVTQSGVTSVTTSNVGPAAPDGFKLGLPPGYFDITTTAIYTPPIQVCIDYSAIAFKSTLFLRLYHFENGAWVNHTTSQNTAAHTICATVNSLSPFAVLEPEPDTTPPAITGLTTDKASLSPPNHKLVDVSVSYSVVDAVDPAPRCTLSVTSNEPIDGTGDGDTAPDWIVLDTHRVQLRAERAGTGSGRVYTLGLTCSDASGSAATKSVTVRVPKSQ